MNLLVVIRVYASYVEYSSVINSRCIICAMHVRFCQKSTEAVSYEKVHFYYYGASWQANDHFCDHFLAKLDTENLVAVSEVRKSEKNCVTLKTKQVLGLLVLQCVSVDRAR